MFLAVAMAVLALSAFGSPRAPRRLQRIARPGGDHVDPSGGPLTLGGDIDPAGLPRSPRPPDPSVDRIPKGGGRDQD